MTTGSVHHFVVDRMVDFSCVPSAEIRTLATAALRRLYDAVNTLAQAFVDGNAETVAEAVQALVQNIAYVNCAMTELTNRQFGP